MKGDRSKLQKVLGCTLLNQFQIYSGFHRTRDATSIIFFTRIRIEFIMGINVLPQKLVGISIANGYFADISVASVFANAVIWAEIRPQFGLPDRVFHMIELRVFARDSSRQRERASGSNLRRARDESTSPGLDRVYRRTNGDDWHARPRANICWKFAN